MSRPPYVSVHVKSTTPGRRVAAKDIVAAIAGEARAGRLPEGARLPPVRVLEQQLGLSKNTVQAAYDELCARAVLEAREREGVFVARSAAAPDAPRAMAPPPAPRLRAPALPAPALPGRDVIALSTVFIDPELLPRERLAECARSVLKERGLEPLYDWQGHRGLREAIAARLSARGMSARPEEVVITAGSQQALDVVARTLEVRRIAVEDPVYPHARLMFASHGLEVTPLELDPFEGLPLDRWETALAAARPGLFYAITSFQNPTGYSYTSHELERVLALSRAYGFALLEDDWGSDMLSGSEYRPTLRALGGGHVVYVNSFTKKLLPSLRLGFLVADEALVPSLVAQKRLSTLGNPALLEAVLAEFLERGYYDAHLAALQRELDRRYERCLAVLRERMPEGVRWTTPGGGPTLWLEVPREVDLGRLERTLAGRGVSIESTALAFAGRPHLHGFRVSYAFLGEAALERALGIVGEELARA